MSAIPRSHSAPHAEAHSRDARRRLWVFVLVNVLGGIAVLGSYAQGFLAHPDRVGDVWGGVPESLKPLYTTTMLLAAAGYFLFTSFLLLRTDPARVRTLGGRFGFGAIVALYLGVLVPSALWMPLTFEMLEAPSTGLWLAIRLVLAAVGLSSLGLLAAFWTLAPARRGVHFWLGIAGLLAFGFQTAVLDMLVWPAYYPF